MARRYLAEQDAESSALSSTDTDVPCRQSVPPPCSSTSIPMQSPHSFAGGIDRGVIHRVELNGASMSFHADREYALYTDGSAWCPERRRALTSQLLSEWPYKHATCVSAKTDVKPISSSPRSSWPSIRRGFGPKVTSQLHSRCAAVPVLGDI